VNTDTLHTLRGLALRSPAAADTIKDALADPVLIDRVRRMCIRSLDGTAKTVDYAQLGGLVVGHVEDFIDTHSIDAEARPMRQNQFRRSA